MKKLIDTLKERAFERLLLPLVNTRTDNWSTEVIRRTYGLLNAFASTDEAPEWLQLSLQGVDRALVPVGHGWALKAWGRVKIFRDRKGGWQHLHELLQYGQLLDRNSEMTQTGLKRTADGDRMDTGLKARVKNLQNSIQRKINKALAEIRDHDEATYISIRASYDPEKLTFSDRGWVTSLDQVAHDASMIYCDPLWEIRVPGIPLVKMHTSGNMRMLAKLLTADNLACPAGLIYDDALAASLIRPPHAQYFIKLNNWRHVHCCSPVNGPIENAICETMWKVQRPERKFLATDQIAPNSLLCKFGLATGVLTLTPGERGAAACLTAILNLLEKERARSIMRCNVAGPEIERVIEHMKFGAAFVASYKEKVSRIGIQTENHHEAVRKAIYRATEEMREMALLVGASKYERYHKMANFFERNIVCGPVMQYRGAHRFKVEGVPHLPDSMQIALDEHHYQRARERRVKDSLTMSDRYIIHSIVFPDRNVDLTEDGSDGEPPPYYGHDSEHIETSL